MVVDKESRQPVPGPMNSIIHSRTWDVPSQLQHDAYVQSCTSQAPQASHKYENNSRTWVLGKKEEEMFRVILTLKVKRAKTQQLREIPNQVKRIRLLAVWKVTKENKGSSTDWNITRNHSYGRTFNFWCYLITQRFSICLVSYLITESVRVVEHLTDQLVFLCGVSRDDLIKGCPGEIAAVAAEGKLLWATILALVLLMGKYLDQNDEWEMIDEKGKTWLKKNLPSTVTTAKILETAAATVGVEINSGLWMAQRRLEKDRL